MADPVKEELLLACGACRQIVSVAFHPAHKYQGLVDPDEHRTCSKCGKDMVETERGDCGHSLLPGEDCECSIAIAQREQAAGEKRRGPS